VGVPNFFLAPGAIYRRFAPARKSQLLLRWQRCSTKFWYHAR